MTEFSNPNHPQVAGFESQSELERGDGAKIGQGPEISSGKINPDAFYKRRESEPERKTQVHDTANQAQADQFPAQAVKAQMPQRQSAVKEAQSGYFVELANAIKANPRLRQRFLDIVAPNSKQSAQENVPAQTQALAALAEPILDRENGTQQGITCALDFSLADVEARMPYYFSGTPARSQLRDYLRENCPNLSADELYKVLNLAIGLENQAIEHYKNGLRHQKNISAGNAAAISKLSTNSAQGKGSGLEFNKIFTRADIRSMPIEDFRKNEKEIFAQYRAGLIK